MEGLRALAVLVVALYHARLPWLSGGYVGVDVFYVISGFLIAGLLWQELEGKLTGASPSPRSTPRQGRRRPGQRHRGRRGAGCGSRLRPQHQVVLHGEAMLAHRWEPAGLPGNSNITVAYGDHVFPLVAHEIATTLG